MLACGFSQTGQYRVVGGGVVPSKLLPDFLDRRLMLPLKPETPGEHLGQQGIGGIESRGLPDEVLKKVVKD